MLIEWLLIVHPIIPNTEILEVGYKGENKSNCITISKSDPGQGEHYYKK